MARAVSRLAAPRTGRAPGGLILPWVHYGYTTNMAFWPKLKIINIFQLAGGLGFEPRLTESESAVLPLNYPPTAVSGRDGVVGPAPRAAPRASAGSSRYRKVPPRRPHRGGQVALLLIRTGAARAPGLAVLAGEVVMRAGPVPGLRVMRTEWEPGRCPPASSPGLSSRGRCRGSASSARPGGPAPATIRPCSERVRTARSRSRGARPIAWRGWRRGAAVAAGRPRKAPTPLRRRR